MNSMSKGPCKCEKEKEIEVLLKCKTGNPVTVTVGTVVTTNTLAAITLNNEHLKNPCTKFEFASNIVTTLFIGTPVIINFQLFKQCRGETIARAIGPVWVYSRLSTVVSTFADTFSFSVCDCDCDCESCLDDCCIYTVVATTPAVAAGVAGGIATINNPILSALVVENKCHF